jgi:DNA-binding response OmpR family regulator
MNGNIKNYRIQSQTLQAYSFLLILQFHFTGTSYDLVLSDVKIPGMNGFDFITKIREIDSKVIVLLMTDSI